MEKLKMHTSNITDANIQKLAELFPNCVTETQDETGNPKRAMNFDLLQQELSNNIVDGTQERYQLNWVGKKEALLTANAPIAKTLRPCKEESDYFDTTQNLFIEGDNLDALKLLQETYLEKIKVIYIDPPYNTGNDFIYEDNFSEDNSAYLNRSNQTDNTGNRLIANTESNGRFHSDWLSMMYSRLKLARNLLKGDGVIFISIGVDELANLKRLMDELFGEANFIEIFSWVKTSTPPALSTKSRKTNEYIICYEKSRNSFQYKGELLDGGDQPLLNTGNTLRSILFPKDKVFFSFIKNGKLKAGTVDRVQLVEDIEILNGYSVKDFVLRGEFKWIQSTLDEEIKNGTTFIVKSEKLSIRFIRQGEGYKRPTNFIKEKYTTPLINKKDSDVGTNETATAELEFLVGKDIFSYPKPTSLIKYLCNFVVESEDTVLDFFAGSSSTAHAVMELNAEDGGNRKFIMVQVLEECDEKSEAFKAGFKTIPEISKERIRRAGNKIKKENPGAVNLDVGYRVLKIDTSNMADVFYNPDAISQDLLTDQVENIKPDRTSEDLLFQVLLDWGVDLTLPISREKIADKEVFFVAEDALAACFETNITEDCLKAIAHKQPMRVVFRDSGFSSDSVKINVEQIFKLISPSTDIKTI